MDAVWFAPKQEYDDAIANMDLWWAGGDSERWLERLFVELIRQYGMGLSDEPS